jgi:hypothetical protein
MNRTTTPSPAVPQWSSRDGRLSVRELHASQNHLSGLVSSSRRGLRPTTKADARESVRCQEPPKSLSPEDRQTMPLTARLRGCGLRAAAPGAMPTAFAGVDLAEGGLRIGAAYRPCSERRRRGNCAIASTASASTSHTILTGLGDGSTAVSSGTSHRATNDREAANGIRCLKPIC